ncbi:hypothetical protein SAMN04488105_110238 [Salipiger thiooxidans]|uniref:Right handed beta helix region n=1 Tax=Salipiger thiooxidans TaxID=282683 RepID=A0A1G7HDL3_9RHOB|nr:hypothetical protein [Salipiger thiooxidans]SDE98515.1 hypothetical protein SAMN04488105_110238 [Salipiger thiooxidans]
MAAPVYALPISGTGPKRTTKALHDAAMQSVINALYSEIGAIATSLSAAGQFDASGGSFPSGAVRGTYYITSVAGTVDGETFAVGDWLLPLTNDASTSTFDENWTRGDYSKVIATVYDTPAALILSLEVSRGPGALWSTKSGLHYQEVTTGEHLTTAGGAKLKALPNADGWITTTQLGCYQDGVTDDYDVLSTVIGQGYDVLFTGICALSGGLHLTTDGQRAHGVMKQTCGTRATVEDQELGLQIGHITPHAAGNSIRHLSMDGRRTNETSWEGGALSARSSGIYLRSTSSDCVMEDLDIKSFTRHGICVLGTGHRIHNVKVDDCVADSIGIGSGQEASNVTRNIRLTALTLGTSHFRGGVEVNDGCHNIWVEDVEVTGSFSNGESIFAVNDHGRTGESNSRITFKGLKVNLDTYQDNVILFAIVSTEVEEALVHTDIVIDDVTAANVGVGFVINGDIDRVKIDRVNLPNARRFMNTNGDSATRTVKNVTVTKCSFKLQPGVSSGGGIRPQHTIGLTIDNCHFEDAQGSVMEIITGCDRIKFTNNTMVNCASNGTANWITTRSSNTNYPPADKGVLQITGNTFQDDNGNMAYAIRVAQSWKFGVITGNQIIGYSAAHGDILATDDAQTNYQVIENNPSLVAA